MATILSSLLGELGPKVTKQVTSKFGLPPELAKIVLPSIAPTVAYSFQEKFFGWRENVLDGLMSNAARVQEDGSMLSNLFGSKSDSVGSNFAKQVNIDTEKANEILDSIVPMIVSFIYNKAAVIGKT